MNNKTPDTRVAGPVQTHSLITAASGLAGGIGNSGFECGGISAPIMFLGLLHREGIAKEEFDGIFQMGEKFMEVFRNRNKHTFCSHILKKDDMPACVKAICSGPALMPQIMQTALNPDFDLHPGLHAGWMLRMNFHCTHSLFDALGYQILVPKDVYDASWPFIGGVLFKGSTCGALIAGIMAIGLKINRVEDSYLRTLNMIRQMMRGEAGAMDDNTNHFNVFINRANRLVIKFRERYGSTLCSELCGIDFWHSRNQMVLAGRIREKCIPLVEETAHLTLEALKA